MAVLGAEAPAVTEAVAASIRHRDEQRERVVAERRRQYLDRIDRGEITA